MAALVAASKQRQSAAAARSAERSRQQQAAGSRTHFQTDAAERGYTWRLKKKRTEASKLLRQIKEAEAADAPDLSDSGEACAMREQLQQAACLRRRKIWFGGEHGRKIWEGG